MMGRCRWSVAAEERAGLTLWEGVNDAQFLDLNLCLLDLNSKRLKK